VFYPPNFGLFLPTRKVHGSVPSFSMNGTRIRRKLPLVSRISRLCPSEQSRRDLRAASAVRNSFPLFYWTSRLTYLVLALICYAIISTLWVDQGVHHEFLLLRHQHGESTRLQTVEETSSEQKQNNKVIRNVETWTSDHQPDVDKIAYVVTITGCGQDRDIPFHIAEGAAVLRHSIHQNSVHGNVGGQYDYQLYAFYHPEVAACAPVLQDLGYTVQERNTPVAVEDIQGEFLRERIVKNGCCGEKELIKLEAFTLVNFKIVVLLDLDVLVMKPLDRLFDFILDSSRRPRDDDLLRPEDPIPNQIDLLYTTDFAMVSPGRKYKPTQGGFVILRPNMTVYNDFVNIVRTGDFRENGGWGGILGKFWVSRGKRMQQQISIFGDASN